ncbi:MAG: TRAP transporter small permease [Desulfobulbaceae bacterium]|nr:TRAP transporter small permease [Desulfobulbaceae bacterium]
MIESFKAIIGLSFKVLDFLERCILISAYFLIPILILIEVISRYLMTSAIIGIEEGCLLIVAYVYYIGAAYALKTKDHITVKALHLFPLSPKVLQYIKYVSTLLSLICASLITWYIIQYFLFVSKSPGLYTPFHFRKVYYVAGPAIGWTLIFIYSVADLINIAKSDNRLEGE